MLPIRPSRTLLTVQPMTKINDETHYSNSFQEGWDKTNDTGKAFMTMGMIVVASGSVVLRTGLSVQECIYLDSRVIPLYVPSL